MGQEQGVEKRWKWKEASVDLGRNRFAKLVSDSFLKPVSDSADKSITLGSLCRAVAIKYFCKADFRRV